MIRRSLMIVGVVVAALAMSTTTAGAAVRPFGPPQTLVGGCDGSADAVVTTGGSLLGYSSCPNAAGRPIRFFSRTSGGTVNPSQATGFSGDVLGVAYDNTATYVLYASGTEIRIGKRTTAGAYSSRAVDTVSGPYEPEGDVIARDGQWFGVWSKEAGAVRLYAAGSTAAPAPVSVPPAGAQDYSPTLAYSGSIPVLVWTRSPGSGAGAADLMVSKYLSGAWQAPRVFASAGDANSSPDMQIVAGTTFVTWVRDDKGWVASNATGTFGTHAFATVGASPTVGVSATGASVDHVFLSWTLVGTSPHHMFFAETASTGSVTGSWDGAVVAPTGEAVATGGFGTKATTVYSGSTSLTARTQA